MYFIDGPLTKLCQSVLTKCRNHFCLCTCCQQGIPSDKIFQTIFLTQSQENLLRVLAEEGIKDNSYRSVAMIQWGPHPNGPVLTQMDNHTLNFNFRSVKNGYSKEIFGYDIVNFIKCLKSDWTDKVEKILKGSLVLIPSPSPPVNIQIMCWKVCLRCKGKTVLVIVNNLLKRKVC